MRPVHFVGAGPGDPELITLKGRRLIAEADVLIYTDSLVDERLCRWAKPGAAVHRSSGLTLEEILGLIRGAVAAGKKVVRLHTGDPSLYGALHEQVAALEREGIPYEIVPGVTAATAAAAALGAELTVPELSQTVIIARAAGRTPVPAGESLASLAAHQATMVLYLSAALIGKAAAALREGGYPPDTPAAVACRVSWPDQRIVRGTLADIAGLARSAGIRSHAVILVGRVLDPALRALEQPHRSRLYDPGFSHGRRRAARPTGG